MSTAIANAPITVREGTVKDHPVISHLRRMHEREFVGQVSIPVNVKWFVAETGGLIVACAGVCMSTALGHNRTAIVTDFYDDGSRNGKRGILALLDDARWSNVRIYAIVPLDKPGLKRALERRGLVASGWQMESPRVE